MKKLTRTEANFENLLEAAILLEGHCRHAEHGCSCRGCDECEENYRVEQEEGEAGLTLDELIKRELGRNNMEQGPDTDVPYGDDPRADSEEYDEDQESLISPKTPGPDPLSTAIKVLAQPLEALKANPVLNTTRIAAQEYLNRVSNTLNKGK